MVYKNPYKPKPAKPKTVLPNLVDKITKKPTPKPQPIPQPQSFAPPAALTPKPQPKPAAPAAAPQPTAAVPKAAPVPNYRNTVKFNKDGSVDYNGQRLTKDEYNAVLRSGGGLGFTGGKDLATRSPKVAAILEQQNAMQQAYIGAKQAQMQGYQQAGAAGQEMQGEQLKDIPIGEFPEQPEENGIELGVWGRTAELIGEKGVGGTLKYQAGLAAKGVVKTAANVIDTLGAAWSGRKPAAVMANEASFNEASKILSDSAKLVEVKAMSYADAKKGLDDAKQAIYNLEDYQQELSKASLRRWLTDGLEIQKSIDQEKQRYLILERDLLLADQKAQMGQPIQNEQGNTMEYNQ